MFCFHSDQELQISVTTGVTSRRQTVPETVCVIASEELVYLAVGQACA